MTLKEFSESHGVNIGAVSVYIKRHPDLFKDLINQSNTDKRSVDLSEEAVQILEKKYPVPEPVIVYNHHPDDLEMIKQKDQQILILTDMLKKEHDKNTLLETERESTAALRIQIEDHKYRLEEEKKRSEEERSRADQSLEAAHTAQIELEKEKILREKAEEELERIRKRGFWARVLNR